MPSTNVNFSQLCMATITLQVSTPIPYIIGSGGGSGCTSYQRSWKQTYDLSLLLGGFHVEHSGVFTYNGCSAFDANHICNRNMAYYLPAVFGLNMTGCRDNGNGSSTVDAEADYFYNSFLGGFTQRLDATCTEAGNIYDPSIVAA